MKKSAQESSPSRSQGTPKVCAVDLFCGAGGLTCGLRRAGIRVEAGVDNAEQCRYAFEHNNRVDFLCRSVSEVRGSDLLDFLFGGDFSLLAGCAPCQPFSSFNRLKKSDDAKRSAEEFGAPRRTVRDAIGTLPPLSAGGVDPSDPLHRCCGLSALNLARIRASRPGGTWRDWPESLRSPCHRKATGSSYKNVYGRMEWDRPSPTMTTQFVGYGTGRFGHPEQDRAVSLREGALLQSFPADYEFVAPGTQIELFPVARMIGNAVPVAIGELLGRSILKHLESLG